MLFEALCADTLQYAFVLYHRLKTDLHTNIKVVECGNLNAPFCIVALKPGTTTYLAACQDFWTEVEFACIFGFSRGRRYALTVQMGLKVVGPIFLW